MALKAIFNSIIVKPLDEEEQTYGSIIVPDLGKTNGLVGNIVSVGEGYWTFTGTWIKSTLKEGQKVVLPATGATKIAHEGQDYWSCPESQVLAIIE